MRKKIIIFGILSIVYIIGFPFFKQYVLDAEYIITIETTGLKNDVSQGTEIWIDSVLKDGECVGNDKILLKNGWENRGRLYHAGTEVSEWSITVKSKEQTQIVFLKHPYSGIVRIKNPQGEVKEVDLYSEEESIYVYTIEY